MTSDRTPRSIRNIHPSKGLHRLKRDFQKQFMSTQCKQLVQVLDEAIEVTWAAAPVRGPKQPYLPDRPGFESHPVGKEALLERALYAQWTGPKAQAAKGCWEAIVAFQVNVPNRRVKGEGWGEIDLIGVAEDGLPVVIEVKAERSAESPAHLLVQAAAYGIALQKAWSFSLKSEWQKKVVGPRLGPNHPMPDSLSPCRLVCAAPEKYWEQWRGSPSKSWVSFIELAEAFADRRLQATFVSLESIYRPSVLELGKWTARVEARQPA